MADDSGSGIVLGIIGSAVGIVAVDYMFSDPGDSWVDHVLAKFKSHETPEEKAAPGATAPARRTAPTRPQVHARVMPPHVQPRMMQPHYQTQQTQVIPPQVHAQIASPDGYYRQQVQHQPAARRPAPQVVTPDVVNEVIIRINDLFQLRVPAVGLVTADVKQAVAGVQKQLGLQPTGFPDARLLQQLRILGTLPQRGQRAEVRPPIKEVAKEAATPVAPVTTQVTNFISKTFGGPPSSPATGPDEGVRKTQGLLNKYFKSDVLVKDGILWTHTTNAIKEFQQAEGLPVTGTMDDKTHDLLEQRVADQDDLPSWWSSIHHRTGAAAADSKDAAWLTETKELGPAAQAVISKTITDGNPRTLQSLGKVLSSAGFPQASAAVSAKAG
jgi:peptidoglycan hydrolase-like protein with peptidoglycan-binding domain